VKVLLRIVVAAFALYLATLAIHGIQLQTTATGSKVLTLLVVALIFGLVNAVLKPVIKTVGCVFYVLTLGLIALVVNGLLLWLTSWVAGELSVPFHVTGFWPAFWGAILIGVVSWLLNLIVGDKDSDQRALTS
jgi:putative membrane protein